MSAQLRMGIVGFGTIAREQHRPAIEKVEGIELCAVASLAGAAEDLPSYGSLAEMLSAHPEIDAVAMCQPPAARFEAAREALQAGRHVLLEKPPATSVAEVRALEDLATDRGLTVFTAWHSRFAAGVPELVQWCSERTISRIDIVWKEDVRRWHPGQDWIWKAGGFGVFDPGINALSIMTAALGGDIRLNEAALTVPANCDTPIAASLKMETSSGGIVTAEFDWRETGPQIWEIKFQAEHDVHIFDASSVGPAWAGVTEETTLSGEYVAIYRRFIDLVASGRCEVDCSPLRLADEALRKGRVFRGSDWRLHA